jgi:putative peptidoglycan lipid II flippase
VLVITQLLNIVLVPMFAHAALTLSIGIGAMINALWLLWGLLRRGSYKPEPGWGIFVLRVGAACSLLLFFLMWANTALDWTQLRAESFKRIGFLVSVVMASAALYLIVLWALGMKIRQLLKR